MPLPSLIPLRRYNGRRREVMMMTESKTRMEIAAEIVMTAMQRDKFPIGEPKNVAAYLSVIYSQVRKLESMTTEELEEEYISK